MAFLHTREGLEMLQHKEVNGIGRGCFKAIHVVLCDSSDHTVVEGGFIDAACGVKIHLVGIIGCFRGDIGQCPSEEDMGDGIAITGSLGAAWYAPCRARSDGDLVVEDDGVGEHGQQAPASIQVCVKNHHRHVCR